MVLCTVLLCCVVCVSPFNSLACLPASLSTCPPAYPPPTTTDKYKALLKLRDPHKCQLRLAAAFATKADMRRICPQTQLHYSECCGRKNKLNAKGLLKAKRKLLSAA